MTKIKNKIKLLSEHLNFFFHILLYISYFLKAWFHFGLSWSLHIVCKYSILWLKLITLFVINPSLVPKALLNFKVNWASEQSHAQNSNLQWKICTMPDDVSLETKHQVVLSIKSKSSCSLLIYYSYLCVYLCLQGRFDYELFTVVIHL